jgi:hypothetical protein
MTFPPRATQAGSVRILGVLAVIFAGLLLAACDGLLGGNAPPAGATLAPCRFPTPRTVPVPWQPVGDGLLINIDGDSEQECVLVYRYNVTGDNQGPLGGVILNPQPASEHESDLAVYRLLPWINRPYLITDTIPGALPGKLGYIGEKGYEIRLYDSDAKDGPDELGIIGTDLAGNKTYLSFYRWVGPAEGYRLVGYFHGNARVEIVNGPTASASGVYSGVVQTVHAVDRLYERSGLAMVYEFRRADANAPFTYYSNRLEFVDGNPPGNVCLYPEGRMLTYFSDLGSQVFDLRLWYEDDRSRRATVCVGWWKLSENEWRRYFSIVELEKQESSTVDKCDEWLVRKQSIEPGRLSCLP